MINDKDLSLFKERKVKARFYSPSDNMKNF